MKERRLRINLAFGPVSLRGDGRLRGKRSHPGFLALRVAIDDHSRMVFTQMLPDQKTETTIGFLNSAVEFTPAVFLSPPVRNGPRTGCELFWPHVRALHQWMPRTLIEKLLPS